MATLQWGPVAHSMTARLATLWINAHTQSHIEQLLNGHDMHEVASWADEIRSKTAYHWTEPLHFIDTPEWSCHYEKTYCTQENQQRMCVEGAIQNYTQRMMLMIGGNEYTNRNTNVNVNVNRAEDGKLESVTDALKMIIHLVGDIHQPLHVGFRKDRGGNDIHGTFIGKHGELHAVWDTHIVEKRMEEAFEGDEKKYTQYLQMRVQKGDLQKQASGWVKCTDPDTVHPVCPADWANESAQLACSNAYVKTDGKTHIQNGYKLQQDWFERNWPVVEVQIAKGGVRLAALLDFIFKNKPLLTEIAVK